MEGEEPMTRKEDIKSAYKSLGNAHGFYDGMMLGTTFAGRLVLRYVWDMKREDALEYQSMAFEPIPADFSGKLLEIKVPRMIQFSDCLAA